MEIDLPGIDLAKRVFQLHGTDVRRRAVYRNKASRTALIETVRAWRPQMIAMTRR
jgi:transposase